MIASIEGKVLEISGRNAVIAAGGIGYRIFTTSANLEKLKVGENIFFHTHLAVRENSQDLYGFREKEELSFFELLVSTVSGIGPKSAMAIMSVATLTNLRHAVTTGDISHLTKVSGIGRKNAEKIVLELKDKLEDLSTDVSHSISGDVDAMEALKSLGYGEAEIRETLKKVVDVSDTGEKVKKALKLLS